METHDIPLDKAELLSVLLEGLLYGFSLLMFGGTMWALLAQRAAEHVNRKMLGIACMLLLFSTAHFVIDIIRVMQGFILFRNTFPGGPIGYFSDVSHWTFVSKNYVYAFQTLIGDGVALYRCYVVWQSKLVMIVPVLLWCVVGVTGIAGPCAELKSTAHEVFIGSVSWWITSFWASTLVTNFLTTLLLASRIWYVDHRTTTLGSGRLSHLRPILRVIIDAGVIYSVTLFISLLCFVNRSNVQYILLDMITHIISITFYMIIIRIGLAHRESQMMHRIPFCRTSFVNGERMSRTQIHIISTHLNVENEPRSPMRPTLAVERDVNRRSKIIFEHFEELT